MATSSTTVKFTANEAKAADALASGIASGIGYGDNCKAALITRGMAEITRLGTAMGCDTETFWS